MRILMKYNGHFRQSSLNLPLVGKKPPSFLSRALLISGHFWSCGLLNKLINPTFYLKMHIFLWILESFIKFICQVLIGEGNGNPLQCSCLENPRDGGAWWAAVYGIAQSWTRLKRLSSSSSSKGWWNKKVDTEVPCSMWGIPNVGSTLPYQAHHWGDGFSAWNRKCHAFLVPRFPSRVTCL